MKYEMDDFLAIGLIEMDVRACEPFAKVLSPPFDSIHHAGSFIFS